MPPDTLAKATGAALKLAAQLSWNDVTLGAIADEAGLDLGALFALKSRDGLIVPIFQKFDAAMSADGALRKGPPRERLFDAIMMRFEAMEPDRVGLMELLRSLNRSPFGIVKRGEAHLAAANWAMVVTGLDTDEGAPRSVKAIALARVVGRAEKAWLSDAHGDFAQTMAELDKALRETEERLSWLSRFTSRRDAPASSTPDPEPKPE